MATPMPEGAGEAFAESAAEAVQTAVMAFRLVSVIADAVRRQQQRRAGKEEELPGAEDAEAEASEGVKKLLPPDISAALLGAADWPQLAQQLVALKRAGVDLEMMLPRFGEIAVSVRVQVAANAKRVAREGTDEWVKALRETLPAGPVREALLASPAWPEMAATMARLDARGVDVRAVLAAAYEEGVGVDRAVAKKLAADAPTTSRDARLVYGPLTTGLDIPADLDLGDRERALRQLGIAPLENQRFVRIVRESLPIGREVEVGLVVAARQWPLLAARMADMESKGQPVAEHLDRLARDTSWQEGSQAQLGQRLVMAANDALRKPVGAPAGRGGAVVDTAAARATSPSVGPTKAAAKGGATPAVPGVAAHREAGPATKSGKTR